MSRCACTRRVHGQVFEFSTAGVTVVERLSMIKECEGYDDCTFREGISGGFKIGLMIVPISRVMVSGGQRPYHLNIYLTLLSTRTKKKEARENKYINPTAAHRQVFRKPTRNKGVVCKTGLPILLPLFRDLERPLPF